MKFKSNIETQAGIEDSAASAGAAGQLLSSLGPVAGVDGVEWVDQSTIVASAATLVEIECKNTSGSTITKGTPVYQTGNVGATAVIEIAEADALISANKGPAIGLLQDTLTNNAFGFVVIIGELLNLTTSPIDGVTPTVGDKIFVKSGGGLTTVKPTTSLNSIQAIGLVGKVSGGNAGSVTVSSTMRANDVPNLPEGRIWIGDGNTIVSDTVYVDEPNNRVGINTATPLYDLDVDGVLRATSTSYFSTDGPTSIAQLGGGSTTLSQFNITTTASGSSFIAATNTLSIKANNTTAIKIDNVGNVGIGTTGPGSKLEVAGEIDATTGDGYKINGKPWANENANILKLGDWDGEGFSTSIFDENSSEIFKVKDRGVIINCDRTSAAIYGADASLVVGGDKSSPWGAGVVTLLNNDPTSQAGDSTGLIQFAIRDDDTTSAGYTSASIQGSISQAAGSGNPGGGILDFKTGATFAGSSPQTRMRINQLGNVGIGTTSPQSKLQVNGGVQLASDTASPSAAKAGTFRYRTSGNNSYVDMCMQTGASTYAWVNIVQNNW